MPYYTTITSKGQITLPADLRRLLKLDKGKRVSVKLGANDQIIIEAPPTVDDARAAIQSELQANGISDHQLRSLASQQPDGWLPPQENKS